uniref:PA domain-containing protein n=1 Tax=Steinernema glaseri TaxID=37863 RepID=A0A1I7Y1I9_9BILA
MLMRSMLVVLFLLFSRATGHFFERSARGVVLGEADLYETEEIEDIEDVLKRNIRWEGIRDNLREFTREPHVAGSEGNNRLAETIADKWKAAGLEDVHFTEYDVLLSYPNYSSPNHVSILGSDGTVLYKNKGRSPVIFPDEQGAPGADVQWVAYAAEGTVVGDVVYAHYGRSVDFDVLKKAGVHLKGKIALLRYSNGFRGDKVRLAQQHGAIGAILYSDPAEVARDGSEEVYPSTEWMPSGGVQRGTLKTQHGDPLTPLYPAKPDLYPGRTIHEAKKEHVLPSIPAVPLSYGDAWHILSRMEGKKVPAEWQGGLNVTYRMGPGLRSGQKVKIDVRSSLEKR